MARREEREEASSEAPWMDNGSSELCCFAVGFSSLPAHVGVGVIRKEKQLVKSC